VAAREERIERQWRDARIRDVHSRVKLEQFWARAFQRDGYGARDAPRDRAGIPAPYRQEVADRVPDPPSPNRGTSGRLVVGDDREGLGLPFESGAATGAVDAFEQRLKAQGRQLPAGFSVRIRSHVEAHVAAYMRMNGIDRGSLYINRAPCPGPRGCDANLSRILPPGAQLTVFAPGARPRVYRGEQPREKET